MLFEVIGHLATDQEKHNWEPEYFGRRCGTYHVGDYKLGWTITELKKCLLSLSRGKYTSAMFVAPFAVERAERRIFAFVRNLCYSVSGLPTDYLGDLAGLHLRKLNLFNKNNEIFG